MTSGWLVGLRFKDSSTEFSPVENLRKEMSQILQYVYRANQRHKNIITIIF